MLRALKRFRKLKKTALQRLRETHGQPAQVVAAIQAAPYRAQALPLEAVLSLPVLEAGWARLAFCWYSVGGPVQNRTISAPYCRTLADPDSGGASQHLIFQPIEPQALGIELPRTATLGKPTIGGRIPTAALKQARADFYRATDGVLALYVRAVLSPNAFSDEDERAALAAYREAFLRLAVVALLPAYPALSPHFFTWVDAVLDSSTAG